MASSPAPSPILVIGGAGYLGRNLALALLARGDRVRVFDRVLPKGELGAHPDVECITGDLRNPYDVARAVEGCKTVFHAASMICALTIAPRALREQVQAVNVQGTRNVLDACLAHGVERLVYTSSINVVPVPTDGGDETRRYHLGPLADLYSRTKATAERMVLATDGAQGLRTCALRPGGIYGPGEEHHFPRFIKELKAGKMIVGLGDGKTRADNVYIDDLVSSHIHAADRLGPGTRLGGQAYFITDGEPRHYFEFFRPAVEALGHKMPRFNLPGPVLIGLAWASEVVHFAGGPWPFTTAMEAGKLVKENWVHIDRARRDLEWAPAVNHAEGMRRSMPYIRSLYDAA
ncbi:MAG: NAD-dependent epimerase/dehydratase family protein [Myxococcales bacterium]|nr:NAD-dependent epimerase/dehydratase family protein [Myxococcales bacterium]